MSTTTITRVSKKESASVLTERFAKAVAALVSMNEGPTELEPHAIAGFRGYAVKEANGSDYFHVAYSPHRKKVAA